MAANCYGPSLPSDMLEQEPDKGISVTRESTACVYGPSLPPDLLTGDKLDETNKKEKVSRIGVDTRPVIGPSLPPDLSLDQKETDTPSSRLPSSLVSVQESEENDRFIGPCIPSTSQPNSKPALEEVKEDVDVSVIGPELPTEIDQVGHVTCVAMCICNYKLVCLWVMALLCGGLSPIHTRLQFVTIALYIGRFIR